MSQLLDFARNQSAETFTSSAQFRWLWGETFASLSRNSFPTKRSLKLAYYRARGGGLMQCGFHLRFQPFSLGSAFRPDLCVDGCKGFSHMRWLLVVKVRLGGLFNTPEIANFIT